MNNVEQVERLGKIASEIANAQTETVRASLSVGTAIYGEAFKPYENVVSKSLDLYKSMVESVNSAVLFNAKAADVVAKKRAERQ